MCPVGSYCWDSGEYENSGCKTEAAPTKCATVTCTGGNANKGGYCGDDCTETTCCKYEDCTGETFSEEALMVLLGNILYCTLLTPFFLFFSSFFFLFFLFSKTTT